MRGENPIRAFIAAKIALARDEAGLSRAELAERAGCTTQAIHTYETEKADPSFPMLFAISKALGKPWSWFFDGAAEPDSVTVPRERWDKLRQLESAIVAVAGRPDDMAVVRKMLTVAEGTRLDAAFLTDFGLLGAQAEQRMGKAS